MRRFLFAVILIVACASCSAADPTEDAYSAYKRGDYTQAARLFRPLAEQGDASAQNNLGVMYAKGQGVPQDYILAHMWFNLAASAVSGDSAWKAENSRNDMESRMSTEQIGTAQKMARRCQQSQFKECY